MKTKQRTLRSLALASTMAVIAAGQTADAIIIFEVVDSNTFTLTADGGSLDGDFAYSWGLDMGIAYLGFAEDEAYRSLVFTNGEETEDRLTADVAITEPPLFEEVIGFQLSGFGEEEEGVPVILNDGDTLTVNMVDRSVDLTTLIFPTQPLPFNQNFDLTVGPSVQNNITTGNVSLVFTTSAVPEPSTSMILGLGACAMLLRRKRRFQV